MNIKYFRVVLIFLAIISLGGCGENEPDQRAELTSPIQTNNLIAPIKNQNIVGEVRNTKFRIEQAIIDNGTLKLRQGNTFFADVSVEIITFENEDISGKSFNSSNSVSSLKPHIRLGIKKESENLPDEVTIIDNYELKLIFGNKESLGIPFSIKLISLKNGTNIEGKSFATYKNIRVKYNAIDTQLDSFDTLEYLAKKYIEAHSNESKLGVTFGIEYSSYGKDYPKIGFVGYEINTSTGEHSVAKIQLAKDKDGWKAVNQLSSNQIHQAHPPLIYIEGNLRTVEGVKAKKVAAQKLEANLNEQGIIENVRATSLSCYLTKKAHKASCRAVYGLKIGDKVECHNKNYLLINDGSKWKFEADILDTQKVDYNSGELIKKNPFSMMCQ